VGYRRAANFASPGGFVQDAQHAYSIPKDLKLNQWALGGSWLVTDEMAMPRAAHGRIAFRFFARDLHLVMGPGDAGKPVRFRVLLDGAPPGADHGVDVDADGAGTIDGQRLYQLIRQRGDVGEHVFTIEFLDVGADAYSFTFG
jgi:hypothetical protein